MYPHKKYSKTAKKIEKYLLKKYSMDISIKIKMGKGFRISHLVGIVVAKDISFGENLTICQNTVITQGKATFGNNVTICSNCVIYSKNITVGNNVTIGALSYIDKDIPSNCTVRPKKTNEIVINQ